MEAIRRLEKQFADEKELSGLNLILVWVIKTYDVWCDSNLAD